jgi:hypothetical protein
MKRPPIQIATPTSALDVSEEVKRLLRASGVKDQLPTPRSEIIACARLVESGEIDLEEYKATFLDRTTTFFHKSLSKVLGFLDRRSEIIYIDRSIHDSRQLFVTYHEVVHKILPWQQFEFTEEDESTLSRQCKDIFESEANFGAAEILFQCERFDTEARDYNLSVKSALYLADRYDASCHATLRRFVEGNHRPCLLLVLKPTSREYCDGRTSYFITYSIPSSPFTAEFGEPLDLKFINPSQPLGKILNGTTGHGEIVLSNVNGFPKTCMVEMFSNNFNTFVLIYPKDIGRSRFIVQSPTHSS